MSEKFIKTRVTQKHDTESNWLKTSFVPNQGELIIYDIEENVSSYERIKIGDGIHNINELPFVTDIEIPQSDWQQNDPSAPDYIKNRLAYIDSKTLTYDGSLDEYFGKYDMPDDVGGFQYAVKLLDTPIDLYSVTKVQIMMADGSSEMFELSEDNSRIESSEDIDGTASTLYISHQGMELPVLYASDLFGTLVSYYESVYGGITCWTSYIEYDEVIHHIDQKFIPDTMATDEEVVNMIDSHNTDTSAHDDIRQLISEKLIYNDQTLTPEQQTQARENIGAMSSDTEIPSIEGLASEKFVTDKIAAIPTPDVSGQIGSHNTATDSHNDIRLLVSDVATRLNALADSDDETLDQMSEIVAYIRSNKNLIDAITTGKVSVTDIINNLTTNVANKPLSAAQGVALKALIDAIVVPTKVSELTNDKGYLTSYTETDPTVPAWAKAAKKPSYTKSEVGLGNVENVKQYSKNNPPVVVQAEAPTDTSVIWVDPNDEYVDEFSEAVNSALAQAKESGEFNPVKGVDYWTDADQEDIVQQVIAALGTPVFGRVDADKNIILTGELVDGTYTLWFEGKNGKTTKLCTYAHDTDAEVTYTNWIPLSTDSDGNIYNGTGYKVNTRGNSSGASADITNTDAPNAVFFTGFIPAPTGSVIRLKNCFIYATDNTEYATTNFGDAPFGLRSGLYDASKALVSVESWGNMYAGAVDKFSNYTKDSNNHITEFTVAYSGISFVRLCLAPTGDPADAIVTVNQEID